MPSHVRPLAKHPQLQVQRTALSDVRDDEVVEYRVRNFTRWRDGTVVRGDGPTWLDLVWTIVLAGLYKRYDLSGALRGLATSWTCSTPLAIWTTLFIAFVYSRTRTVLSQSVVALPSLGVQLETTRGLSLGLPFADPLHSPCIPISTSATFMPLEEISTIVVNEGLRLWRVEYYLAVVHRGGRISVAYDVVRPPGPVLKEVLHGLRETLYGEYDEASNEDKES